MRSFTCDRCGKSFPNKVNQTLWIQDKWKNPMKIAGVERKTIDLCPGCEMKLREWLKSSDEESI